MAIKINLECSEREARKLLDKNREKPIINIKKIIKRINLHFKKLTTQQKRNLLIITTIIGFLLLLLIFIEYQQNKEIEENKDIEIQNYLISIEDKTFLEVLSDYIKLKLYVILPILFIVICISWLIHGVGFRIA